MLLHFFKIIGYKIPVTSLDELKLRIVAAIETVTPQMLENTWRETEYRLDILRATKGANVEVVIVYRYKKHFRTYTFIFRKNFCFVVSDLKIIGHGNPDNNLESPCTTAASIVRHRTVICTTRCCRLEVRCEDFATK
jgi:hypothetical protein